MRLGSNTLYYTLVLGRSIFNRSLRQLCGLTPAKLVYSCKNYDNCQDQDSETDLLIVWLTNSVICGNVLSSVM